MKVCIFGQGTGGNASIWFSFLDKKITDNKIEKLTFIARTPITFKTKIKVYSPYGRGKLKGILKKIYTYLVSKFFIRWFFKYIGTRDRYDLLLLQGNYTPELNLALMNELSCNSVLNIYGSDFYRNYLLDKFTVDDKKNFLKVIDKVDAIYFNWETTRLDFIDIFPQYEDKLFVSPWGVDSKWHNSCNFELKTWPSAEKVFLSARGLYDYNNVSKVVEAFCKAYSNTPQFKLFIVSGYGSHAYEIEEVQKLIDKFAAHQQVILKIGEWISDEELMALYELANYNICFGDTDQLTVSICYGYLKNAINILSPLPNYYQLEKMGYKSQIICPTTSVQELQKLFVSLKEGETPTENLSFDKGKAKIDFNMEYTFDSYLNTCTNKE